MLGQQVSSDLQLPDVRAHGDEGSKAASYEREGQQSPGERQLYPAFGDNRSGALKRRRLAH